MGVDAGKGSGQWEAGQTHDEHEDSAEYADSSSSHMHQQQDERPSRRLKKESKVRPLISPSSPIHPLNSQLYSFLTRSRSPSRSTMQPGSKPPTRVQSRPLSSTTTVTPSTPKARRFPQQPPLPPVQPSAKPRRRFQDLFNMSLASLSRSRSRSLSRPGTPDTSLDVPPLPTADDSTTPRPRNSFSPHASRRLPNRSPSPTPTGPKVLRVVNTTATASSSNGSTAASIKITRLFTSVFHFPRFSLCC